MDSIYWTKQAEDQYLLSDLSPDDEIGTLDEYCYKIIMDLDEVTELIRGELTTIHRRTLVALVTQDVHYRDIIQILFEEGVNKQSDFWWVQQLKFYLNRRNHAYDYKIVDYDKRNKKEYMTISARGITHYVDNIGEFIKIERWEQEVFYSYRRSNSFIN